MSTIELLIAFAILTLTLTAVISVMFGNQSVTVDSETNASAIGKAVKLLEAERALAKSDYQSAVSSTRTETDDGVAYTEKLEVADLTPCLKRATTTVSWSTDPLRTQNVAFATLLTDVAGALMMGGDCPVAPPSKLWNDPQVFAFDTLSPGKSTAIDELNQLVYMGEDKKPYLAIADTHGTYYDPIHRQPFFVSFTNSFNSDGTTIDGIEDMDVYQDSSTGKTYALLALASSTAQFAIVDVSDIHTPVLDGIRSLKNVNSNGSQPDGYRVRYYDGRAYIVTKETAGPELHIFDLSDPTDPTELGNGTELNTTANDLMVRNGIAYFADDSSSHGAVRAYDVSDPTNVTEYAAARTSLKGSQDAESLYVLGSTLYVGGASISSGQELYLFDARTVSGLTSGFPALGAPTEIGGDVDAILAEGTFIFLASGKQNEEFQVWKMGTSNTPVLVKKYNFGENIVPGGIEYDSFNGNEFIYAAGEATPNLQVLYSPT